MTTKAIELPKAGGKGRALNTNCNIGIYGQKGSRKTSTTEECFVKNKKRLIVFDTLLTDYGNPQFCQANGIRYDAVIYDDREFKETLARCVGKSGSGPFRIVDRCTKDLQLEHMKMCMEYRPQMRQALLTDTTFVIEEITFYMSGSYIEPVIANHMQYGRHSRNNLLGIARVPTKETNSLYRSQLDMIISFLQSEQSAIDWFSEFNSEMAENLRKLQPGEYELIKGDPVELLSFIETA